MSDLLNRLAERGNMVKPKFNTPDIPTVKLDGSSAGETAGHILKFHNKQMTDLGKNLSIQIIKIRKKLLFNNGDVKVYSGEYDSKNDTISLFRNERVNGEWGTSTKITEGVASELAGQFDTKVISIVYGLVDGELVKVTVKGASAAGDDGLYSYTDSFKGTYLFQYKTNLVSTFVQKNRTINYYRLSFSRGEEIKGDMSDIEQYLDIIDGKQPQEQKEPNVDDFF